MSVTKNVEAICRVSDLVDTKAVNGNLWVASDKNRTHDSLVYADTEIANSDRVRSAFAKRTGVKFTDVRCSRLRNYSK
jgi:hypothetical protein